MREIRTFDSAFGRGMKAIEIDGVNEDNRILDKYHLAINKSIDKRVVRVYIRLLLGYWKV